MTYHNPIDKKGFVFPRVETATIGYLLVSVLLLFYLVSVAYESEFIYFHILLGIVVLTAAFIKLEAVLVFIPLALTNPYPLTENGVNLNFSEYLLLIIFLVWFVRLLSVREDYFFPSRFLLPSLMLVAASIVSLAAARYLLEGVLQIVRYVEVLFILFFVLINTLKDPRSIKQTVVFLSIGGAIACLVGLFQFATLQPTTGTTGRVFGWHGGGYGAVVASTLWLALSVAIYERDLRFRLFALIVMPIAGLALILSQTRTWIGAFMVVALVMLLVIKRKIVSKLVLYAGIFLLSIVVILQTNVFGLVEENLLGGAVQSAFRFGTVPGEYSVIDLSLLLRVNVWYHAIAYFLQQPFTGIGVGNLRFDDYFKGNLARPGEHVGYVDNQYIQFFAEAGVVAGIAWILFSINALRTGLYSISSSVGTELFPAAVGLFGSLLVFVVGSTFWVVTPHHELFALMILYVVLLVNIGRLNVKKKTL